jgi:hypothetical protein
MEEINRLIKDVLVIFWEAQMMLPEIYLEGAYSDNKDFDEDRHTNVILITAPQI